MDEKAFKDGKLTCMPSTLMFCRSTASMFLEICGDALSIVLNAKNEKVRGLVTAIHVRELLKTVNRFKNEMSGMGAMTHGRKMYEECIQHDMDKIARLDREERECHELNQKAKAFLEKHGLKYTFKELGLYR